MPGRALHSLADRSGSDSDDCIFDQTNLLQRRRLSITRMRRNSATISGQRLTVARTVNLCLSFFALGLCFVIPTATINGLQYRTASSEEQIEFIYTARYGGYIVGCFAGGFLFNCYNRQFLLFLALLATAIGVLIMPFCRVLSFLMTCTCVTGVTMGLLDTGGNVWLLDLWGRKSAPFMQMMHFCFGLGALIAPLVAQPFIHPYSEFGAHLSINGSRTILPPLGPHLSGNSHPQHLMKRDLSQLAPNISHLTVVPTTGPLVSMNAITTVLPTTVTVPKKPKYADSKKYADIRERKPAVKGTASNVNVPVKTATVPVQSKAPTLPPSESLNKAAGSTKATTIATSSTTPAGNKTNDSSPYSISESRSRSTSTTTPSIPTSRLSKAEETVASGHNDRIPLKTKSLNETVSFASGDSSRESTTKTTSSTVPTQSTPPITSSRSSEQIVTEKHHSIKKVLPEEDQEESWIEQARKKIQKSGKFEIAYAILAAYVFLVSIVFFLFLCLNPRETKSKQEEELDDLHQSSLMRMPLTILMCTFFFVYMGLEVAVGETLKSLQFHQDVHQVVTGEQLIYIFWGSFAFARGVSIFVSMSVSCRTMLIWDIVVCIGAAITLVAGALMPYVLIAGIFALGSGMASIIPTSFIWLERHTQITNRLSALLILSAAVGEIVIPELVSAFIRKTPMALMYVILAVIVLCTMNLVALCHVTSIRGEKYTTKPDRSLYHLASLDDDQDQWSISNKTQQDGVLMKRNKANSFFHDRLNNPVN